MAHFRITCLDADESIHDPYHAQLMSLCIVWRGALAPIICFVITRGLLGLVSYLEQGFRSASTASKVSYAQLDRGTATLARKPANVLWVAMEDM